MPFKSNVEQNGLEETRKAYMLPHNRKEIERMKIQHEWIKGSFGGLIKAPIDYNKKNQKIIDSATADGSDTLAHLSNGANILQGPGFSMLLRFSPQRQSL